MKCHHCTREVKLWQTFCPYCGSRLQQKSFSTITEAPVTLEQESRRKLLRKTVQFALLAVVVIVLASVIRLSPPQANPLPKAAANPTATVLPTSAPVPEVVETPVAPVVVSAPVRPPVAKSETKLKPIDFFADVLEMRGAAKSASPKVRNLPVDAKKAKPVLTVMDEVLPRKVTKPVAAPAPNLPAAQPTASVPIEPEANLELDAGRTLLQPNTGLVSIKSYVPARIYIDGIYSGVTPRSVKLLVGEHSISLMAGGYHEYTRVVKIAGQQQIGILASMSKK